MCQPCIPAPFRYRVSDTYPEAVGPLALPFEVDAISVGPESDFDHYIVTPAGAVQPVGKATLGLTTTVQHASSPDSLVVALRAPHVGLVRGPFRFTSHMSQLAAPSSGTRRSLASIASARRGTVDLLFWPKAPPAFGLRAPRRFAYSAVVTTGTAAEADILIVPAFGTKRQLFTVDKTDGSVAYTSGTLTFRIYGEQYTGYLNGADRFAVTTLATIAITSNTFDNVYEYEGKFDYYRWTVESAAVVGLTDNRFEVQTHLQDE